MGTERAWEEVDKVHSRFCNRIIRIPNCAANGFAEMKLGRESRRGTCLGHVSKY
jgi:hypothetical protein